MNAADEALACLAQLEQSDGRGAGSFYDRVTRAHGEADLDLLVELTVLLAARAGDAERPDARARNLLPVVRTAIALVPTASAALTFLELAREHDALATAPHGHPDGASRRAGAALGSVHNAGDLAAALERHGDEPYFRDLFACWLHESVLRGRDVTDLPAIESFVASLRRDRHALGALPLTRLPIELGAERYASRYIVAGASGWGWDSPSFPGDALAWTTDNPLPRATDVTAPGDARIGAAFDDQCEVSNGKREARVFELAPPLAVDALCGELLGALQLECLAGGGPDAILTARVSCEQAYRALVSVATSGAAYNSSWSAAHGRLAAWRSLAGLVGAAPDATHEEIEALARRCQFAYFKAQTEWFYRLMDLGLAVLRPDRASIAVLAGTDTD